jgi:CRISPR-associated protein Csm5
MSRFTTIRLSLTTVSPLHIGGADGPMSATSFASFRGHTYVLSEAKLAVALDEQGLLEDFGRTVVADNRFALTAYLRERSLLRADFLQHVSLYTLQSAQDPRRDLRPFIRDGLARPFIPGSAVKGVLRTATLYQLLKRCDVTQHEAFLDRFVKQRLRTFSQDGRRGQRGFRERFKRDFSHNPVCPDCGARRSTFEHRLFQHFPLIGCQGRFDPHTDIFRAVKIADSAPFGRDALRVEEVKITSLEGGEKPFSIFAECLPPDQTWDMELTVDHQSLREFARAQTPGLLGLSVSNVEAIFMEPISVIAELADDVLTYERQQWAGHPTLGHAYHFHREPQMRLGWGGGLLSSTLALLLGDELRREVRDTLFVERPTFPAPKSRRVVQAGGTLGWVAAIRSAS